MINEYYAKKFCKDDISKIENYEKAVADTTQTWDLHHRLELTLDGEFALSRDQLKMHDMYYNRPYYELIFLTHAEHSRLHREGRTVTDEHRRKISEAIKGRTLSEEHRRKISEAIKGRTFSEETRKKMSESRKGKNNPMYGKKGPFLGKHHTEDVRKKMSESHKGKHQSDETRRKISEALKRRESAEKS